MSRGIIVAIALAVATLIAATPSYATTPTITTADLAVAGIAVATDAAGGTARVFYDGYKTGSVATIELSICPTSQPCQTARVSGGGTDIFFQRPGVVEATSFIPSLGRVDITSEPAAGKAPEAFCVEADGVYVLEGPDVEHALPASGVIGGYRITNRVCGAWGTNAVLEAAPIG